MKIDFYIIKTIKEKHFLNSEMTLPKNELRLREIFQLKTNFQHQFN